eukprot:TRINITY_DN67623_c0_g1_i1.p2 TRINITY_DN67623_c0_g1~~TRINITY_DN67623_c0_g1_i1.p2  ORF type:complete len:135 (+),score=20.04 TRINITY_DN67623_c0_g1_i1:184-588(+)
MRRDAREQAAREARLVHELRAAEEAISVLTETTKQLRGQLAAAAFREAELEHDVRDLTRSASAERSAFHVAIAEREAQLAAALDSAAKAEAELRAELAAASAEVARLRGDPGSARRGSASKGSGRGRGAAVRRG